MIRVDCHKGQPIRLMGVGIPQGSALSMILSTIYTAFILITKHVIPPDKTTPKHYVDDGLRVAAAKTISETVRQLSQAFPIVYRRLRAIGLDTNHGKFELAHFTRSRKISAADLSTPITLSVLDTDGSPKRLTIFPTAVLRWLGIFFNRKLKFTDHVKIMANRARSTITGLRLVANTVRGLCQASARILYKTVVIPVLTFGAAVWYTGVRQGSLIKPLVTAQNEGLRWLLGAFRTSSIAELHHIGSILPIPQLLDRISRKAATRLQTLPRTLQVRAV